jgi:uncharacterized protein YodC (DUF2158 family)
MEEEYFHSTDISAIYNRYINHNLTHTFKVGDIVKLKNGKSAQKVVAVSADNKKIRCQYLTSRKENDFRNAEYYEPYVEYTTNNKYVHYTTNTEEEYTMKDKLFKTLADNRYGTGLAVDSDGKFVLKMQDNGNFEAFSESDLKKVMPYTFAVKFVGTSQNNTTYHYRGTEGSVAVGDLLLLNTSMSIARVVAVNTESDSATKSFDGIKLVTQTL